MSRVLLERARHLPVEGRRGDVARVVVLEVELLGLVGQRARVLGMDVVDRVDDALSLIEEALPELRCVDRAHRANRRSASSRSTPRSSTTLSRAAWPEITETACLSSPSRLASSSTTASLARPRSGAALTRTFQPSA